MTTPSTVKTFQNKEEFNEGQTERHDEMHLWLNDESNRMKLITFCYFQNAFYRNRKPPEGSEIIRALETYEAERPLYSGYQGSYLLGVIDALIRFSIEKTYRTEADKDVFEKFGKYPSQAIATFFLLCEFKPEFKRVGSIMAQTKIYRNALESTGAIYRKEGGREYEPIIPVVITYDERYSKYANLLKSQGIEVFYMIK